jgi:hypothetical protein
VDASSSRNGPVVGYFDSGNDDSVLIKCTYFIHLLNDYELFKKGFAPWNVSSNLECI